MHSLKRKFLTTFFCLSLIVAVTAASDDAAAMSFGQTLKDWGIQIEILPSSPLYPLKIYWEDLQLIISAPDPEQRALLLITFCNRRLQEISHQISNPNELAEVRLFNLLKRYRQHYQPLIELTQSIKVGSRKLDRLLKYHQREKDRLMKLLQEKESQLGKFWTNEIGFSLFSQDPVHLARQQTNAPQVLGAQGEKTRTKEQDSLSFSNEAGLKLYPLEDFNVKKPAFAPRHH